MEETPEDQAEAHYKFNLIKELDKELIKLELKLDQKSKNNDQDDILKKIKEIEKKIKILEKNIYS